MFKFRQGESFPTREERILKLWQENKTFEKSVEMRKNGPLFSFYDGPPFATGLPIMAIFWPERSRMWFLVSRP